MREGCEFRWLNLRGLALGRVRRPALCNSSTTDTATEQKAEGYQLQMIATEQLVQLCDSSAMLSKV